MPNSLKRPSGRWVRNQAGEGKLALVLAIIVVIAAIYILKLMIPPRIDRAELVSFIETQSRMYVVGQLTMEQLQAGIVTEAGKLGIPLSEETLRFDDSQTRLIVKADYDVKQRIIGGKEWVQHHEIEVEIPRL